jgi:hypothetical protein
MPVIGFAPSTAVMASPLSGSGRRVIRIVDHPFLVLPLALVVQWAAAYLGDLLRRKVRPVPPAERADFDIVLSATLTLLALLIGFSFSMAVSRYDQRKDFEAQEANAIATEYVRADLLPAGERAAVQDLLRRYLDHRIQYYADAGATSLATSSQTLNLQTQLWSPVASAGTEQPTAVTALVVSGMNDVLNAQGYTSAAWANRIPTAAWTLLASTAILANVLLGYRERRTDLLVLMVLPLTVSIALFLIADIDTPNGGVIRVIPHNLVGLSEVLHSR